jgi:hypothetical protein
MRCINKDKTVRSSPFSCYSMIAPCIILVDACFQVVLEKLYTGVRGCSSPCPLPCVVPTTLLQWHMGMVVFIVFASSFFSLFFSGRSGIVGQHVLPSLLGMDNYASCIFHAVVHGFPRMDGHGIFLALLAPLPHTVRQFFASRAVLHDGTALGVPPLQTHSVQFHGQLHVHLPRVRFVRSLLDICERESHQL